MTLDTCIWELCFLGECDDEYELCADMPSLPHLVCGLEVVRTFGICRRATYCRFLTASVLGGLRVFLPCLALAYFICFLYMLLHRFICHQVLWGWCGIGCRLWWLHSLLLLFWKLIKIMGKLSWLTPWWCCGGNRRFGCCIIGGD